MVAGFFGLLRITYDSYTPAFRALLYWATYFSNSFYHCTQFIGLNCSGLFIEVWCCEYSSISNSSLRLLIALPVNSLESKSNPITCRIQHQWTNALILFNIRLGWFLLGAAVVAAMILFPVPYTSSGLIYVKDIISSNRCLVIYLFAWPDDSLKSVSNPGLQLYLTMDPFLQQIRFPVLSLQSQHWYFY